VGSSKFLPVGLPDMVIQRIVRRANVNATATYYIKTAADDVRSGMAKLDGPVLETPEPPLNHTEAQAPCDLR
jgi:hypothetical protein